MRLLLRLLGSKIRLMNGCGRCSRKSRPKAATRTATGIGAPIISVEANGYRIVCVGNRVFHSPKWKTFQDFLRDYPVMLFGEPWMAKQRKKEPAERHPYLQWMQRALDDHKRLATKVGQSQLAPSPPRFHLLCHWRTIYT